MSDKDFSMHTNRRGQMTADVTYLMLKGAGYALAVVLAIWLGLTVIGFVGGLLPEESKLAPDPTPTSFLMAPAVLDGQA